jgi:hypothetical protein
VVPAPAPPHASLTLYSKLPCSLFSQSPTNRTTPHPSLETKTQVMTI